VRVIPDTTLNRHGIAPFLYRNNWPSLTVYYASGFCLQSTSDSTLHQLTIHTKSDTSEVTDIIEKGMYRDNRTQKTHPAPTPLPNTRSTFALRSQT
jgi:hypothetical protein